MRACLGFRRLLRLRAQASHVSSLWSPVRSRGFQVVTGDEMLGPSAVAQAQAFDLSWQLLLNSCTLQDVQPSLQSVTGALPSLSALYGSVFSISLLSRTWRFVPDF